MNYSSDTSAYRIKLGTRHNESGRRLWIATVAIDCAEATIEYLDRSIHVVQSHSNRGKCGRPTSPYY